MEDPYETQLNEALARFEQGETVERLMAAYPDLRQDLAALAVLSKGTDAGKPSQLFARSVVSGLAKRAVTSEEAGRLSVQEEASRPLSKRSWFSLMSPFARFALPVGVAALAMIFVLAGPSSPIDEVAPAGDMALSTFNEGAAPMAKEASLMMAAPADLSAETEIDAVVGEILSEPINDGSQADEAFFLATDSALYSDFDSVATDTGVL